MPNSLGTIEVVQTTSRGTVEFFTPLTATLALAVQAGDHIYVVASQNGNWPNPPVNPGDPSITDSFGPHLTWNLIIAYPGTGASAIGGGGAMWYAIAPQDYPAGQTITVTIPGTNYNRNITVAVLRGVPSQTVASQSGSSPSTASVTINGLEVDFGSAGSSSGKPWLFGAVMIPATGNDFEHSIVIGMETSNAGPTLGPPDATWTPIIVPGAPSDNGIYFKGTFAPAGNIVVHKVTNPGGSSQVFGFTPSYGSPFNLSDGQSNDSGQIPVGTYSVSEAPVPGWSTSTDVDPTNLVVTAGQTTNVTFTNSQTITPSCQLAVAPASLSFSQGQCGASPATQEFAVTNIGSADIVNFTVSADQAWLTLDPQSGSTPATIKVGVNTIGLAPGTYTATISVSSAFCGNPTLTVTLTILQGVIASCIPDPNADDPDVPSLNGAFQTLLASGQQVNPPGLPPGTYNFLQYSQAGPDATAFGGDLFFTICGRERVVMVVPDHYDDDGLGIDSIYQPWLTQMPPNILRTAGYRAQFDGSGTIRMTPVSEDSSNKYPPREITLDGNGPISFEKGLRATEKFISIIISNKRTCRAWFAIQELVMYGNPIYGGSRSPKK